MRESSSDRVAISETRATTFRLLLQYIYTGKIFLRESGSEDSLVDLLGCAHKYGFVPLQHAVSDYLESILDARNVCAIYDIAALYGLEKLERTCVRFIDRNCAALVRSGALLSLSEASLAKIIDRDSFCPAEIDIFAVVAKWHEINKYA